MSFTLSMENLKGATPSSVSQSVNTHVQTAILATYIYAHSTRI